MNSSEDETLLIQSARQGDLEAFNCLALSYQNLIYQQAVWMLGESETAEAVAQETFLLAYRRLHSFRDGDFRCWLLKIANRLFLEELRCQKQKPVLRRRLGNRGCEEVDAAFQVTGLAGSLEGNDGQYDLERSFKKA